MKLADIVASSFRFHNVVYVSLTEKCPLRCRHCFVESSPTREERAELAAFQRWIDGLAAAPGMEILFLSGGEPYNHPRALNYALKAWQATGRYATLCTSVFWAKDDASAARMLDRYPHPNCLWISTDVYHEEFVPLAWIRIAARAAIARGIDVVVQIVEAASDHDLFMERYEREVGYDLIPQDQVYIAPFSYVGRATTEVEAVETEARPQQPSAPCVWLGSPWLHEDGALCACPNLEVFQRKGHPLQVGDLNREDFAEVSRRVEQDAYVQALRVFGPLGLTEQFPVEDWGWRPDPSLAPGPCNLCHSLARTPGLPDQIRAAAARDGMAERIAALRMIYYGEMPEPRTEPFPS